MNDKEFYAEFLKQAQGYVKDNPDCFYYLCLYRRDNLSDKETYLSKFGYIVANKIGCKAWNPKYSGLPTSIRKEVMTELISYLKDKLNQLK